MNVNFLFALSVLVLTKIDNYTLLDYSLMSSPEITENYIDLNLKVTLSSSSESSSWLPTASTSAPLCPPRIGYGTPPQTKIFHSQVPYINGKVFAINPRTESCNFKSLLDYLHNLIQHKCYVDGC